MKIPARCLKVVLILACGTFCCFTKSFTSDIPLEKALALDGLTVDTAQMNVKRFYGMGRFTRSIFREVWEDWTKLDDTSLTAGKKFLSSSGNITSLLKAASEYNDTSGVEVKTFDLKTVDWQNELYEAIAALHEYCGAKLTGQQTGKLKKDIGVVPSFMALKAAMILRAVPFACTARDKAFEAVGGKDQYADFYQKAMRLAVNLRVASVTRKMLEKIDQKSLTAGAMAIGAAVDMAVSYSAKSEVSDFSFSHETSLGLVVINGNANNTYKKENYLLILDQAGDDQYFGGATTEDEKNPVSILIDCSGNDTYKSEEVTFGVGIMGYGMLVDLSGDDSYKARSGVAACSFGAGVILDRQGQDSYSVRNFGIAAGTMGLCALNDMDGDDRYYCFHMAEGHAGVGGCAALVDAKGNDKYIADDEKIIYASPQTRKHNTSLAQGCGFGRRAHPGDRYSLVGGVGILVDGQGDDTYEAGVFAQGISYWFCLGMLVDFSGNDTYSGVWYNQGASAHYSVASLLDLQGDDTYKQSLWQGQGQ